MLILGQCTELTHMQLEGLPNWEAVYDISNATKLFKMVKSLTHQTTDQKYHPSPCIWPRRAYMGYTRGRS